MKEQTKNLAIGLVIGILLAAIAFTLLSGITIKHGEIKETLDTPKQLSVYFTEQMQNKAIEKGMHPIEGFEPFMFMQAYPGLVQEDFDGVESALGIYEYKNSRLEYVETEAQTHSAARAITPDGMFKLMRNVAARLNLDLNTKADVDLLLEELN